MSPVYFKSIELRGFRTYANHTKLEIHEGVNGVVGPDGCGKSSFFAAILWALGSESTGEEIFKGTENRLPATAATVSLNFVEDDRRYSVTRTCRPDGESTIDIEGIDSERHSPQDALERIASAFTIIETLEDLSAKAQSEEASGILIIDDIDCDFSELETAQYAALITALGSRFQIIFVSQDKAMMKTSDYITGVTMEEWGITKLIGMRFTR